MREAGVDGFDGFGGCKLLWMGLGGDGSFCSLEVVAVEVALFLVLLLALAGDSVDGGFFLT